MWLAGGETEIIVLYLLSCIPDLEEQLDSLDILGDVPCGLDSRISAQMLGLSLNIGNPQILVVKTEKTYQIIFTEAIILI